MEDANRSPRYKAHEPRNPADQERLSAAERKERSVETENSPGAVHQRRNTGQPPPSEVRERTDSE